MKYEKVEHEIRALETLHGNSGKIYINKAGYCMVHKYILSYENGVAHVVLIERYLNEDSTEVLEREIEAPPVKIKLFGDIEQVDIELTEPTLELVGDAGTKIIVETDMGVFVENARMEVIL